jgi:hypothetical protein
MSSVDVVEGLDEAATWKEVSCPNSLTWHKDSVAMSRFNLSADGSKMTFMTRPTTLRRVLLKDLLANHPPRIYLDGGQGVGKSHLLLELVLNLRARGYCVVYMPDCMVLANLKRSDELAEKKLLKYILDALKPDDKSHPVIQAALAVMPFHVKRLLEAVVQYLNGIGVRLVLVFDQFNAIAKQGESVWSAYPWSIPLQGVVGATVITSSSANNEALAKVPKPTVRIAFWSPFDASEYLAWKQNFMTIGDWDDADALALTRYVPLFLSELLEAVENNQNYSKGRWAYVDKFLDDTSQLHNMFICKQIGAGLGTLESAYSIESALVSGVPLPKKYGNFALVNRQFSYVKHEGRVTFCLSHHPLFADALVQLRGKDILSPVMALLAEFSRFCQANRGGLLPNIGDITELSVRYLLWSLGVPSSFPISTISEGVLYPANAIFIPPNCDVTWVRSTSRNPATVLLECLGASPPVKNTFYMPINRTLLQIDLVIYLSAQKVLYAIQITTSQFNNHDPVDYDTSHLPIGWADVTLKVLWIARPSQAQLTKKATCYEGQLLCDIAKFANVDADLAELITPYIGNQ